MMHHEQFAELLGRHRTRDAVLNFDEETLANDNDLVVIFPGLFNRLSIRGSMEGDIPMNNTNPMLIMKHKNGDIAFIRDDNTIAFQRLVGGYDKGEKIKYIQIDCANPIEETLGIWLIEPHVRHSKFPISNADGTTWGNGCVINYNEIIEMLT